MLMCRGCQCRADANAVRNAKLRIIIHMYICNCIVYIIYVYFTALCMYVDVLGMMQYVVYV